MDIYSQAVNQIIHQQEEIIGPLAVDQARRVAGIKITPSGEVSIEGNPKDVLGNLVHVYSEFFGHASIEVCKDAIRGIKAAIPPQDLPDVLK